MANANISTVATTNTFDDWRVATNNLITDRNQLRNAPYVKDESNFIVANGELRISRTTNGTLFRVEGTANAYIGYNLEVGSNIAVGNVAVTQNVSTGNLTVSRNTSTGNLTVSRNTSTGNLSVTQNTSTGNLFVTGLANVGSLAIVGFGPIIDTSGNWLGSSTGLSGPAGAQGAQGVQGTQGTQGIGSQGTQGTQGTQGRQGTQGFSIQGVQGTQGLQGNQGTQGFSIQGAQGVQGPAGGGGGGSQGAQGTQGFTGPAGSGSQGAQGTQGFTGPAGSGSQGAQGTTGGFTTGSNAQVNSLGVGTAASGTAGEIRATDNITAYYSSDKRLKENIRRIENALLLIKQIEGVRYNWNEEYIKQHGGEDGYFIRKEDVGVIAQDVQKILPEIVAERADGTLAVRYEKLVALLLAAIKELDEKHDNLIEHLRKVP